MNPGLRYLLAKGPTAFLRRLKRRLRGGRGVATLVGMLFLIAAFVGPTLMRYAELREDPMRLDGRIEGMLLFGPPAVLLLILLTSASGGFQFRPAEIQFLFPAPVSRKELLIYNALAKLRLQLLSGLWIAVITLPNARLWYAAVIGSCLTLAFWQLAAQTIGLLLATIEQRLGPRMRKAIMLAVAAVVLGGAVAAVVRAPDSANVRAILETAIAWPPLYWLSLPLRPLFELYAAATPAAVALWTGVAVIPLLLLVPAMTLFDVAFAESAIARAQKMQKAIERLRAGGSPFAGNVKRGRIHVPRLPYWGGAGPVAWRQLQELTRNYRGVLMLGGITLLMIGMLHFMPRFVAPPGATGRVPVAGLLAMLVVMLPIMATNAAFDFRRDLSRMAFLKTLPISGRALAIGQIIPMTLMLGFWQLVAIAVLWATVTGGDRLVLAAIVPGLIPLNVALVGVDNILFLLLPYRIAARDPGQMPFMPRLMLVMFLKILLLLVIAGLALIPFGIVFTLTRSPILAGLAVAAFLALVCAGIIYGVAAAFRAFDVSRDIPD